MRIFANPTIAKLEAVGLGAMAGAPGEQLATSDLAFEDRLGLLVDKEADARDSRRLATRLRPPSCATRPSWRPRLPRPARAQAGRALPGRGGSHITTI